jgi:hypothetical protein
MRTLARTDKKGSERTSTGKLMVRTTIVESKELSLPLLTEARKNHYVWFFLIERTDFDITFFNIYNTTLWVYNIAPFVLS